MKKKNVCLYSTSSIALLLLIFVCSSYTGSACLTNSVCTNLSNTNQKDPISVPNFKLIAYKNSVHAISGGYYSITGKDILNIPDSVDIVDIWGLGIQNDTANNLPQVRNIQQNMGTKFVQCQWPPNCDGTAAYYDSWARQQYNIIIVQEGLDGLDLDMEKGLVNSISDANKILFMNAITKYFGKASLYTTTRTGKKPVLIFDTDASIGTSLLNQFASKIDYVFFQAYADGHNYWWGNLSALTKIMNSYNAGDNRKFVAIANGQSGSAWKFNATTGGSNAQITEYATWCNQNKAGGVGAFHQETDYSNNPPYHFTRQSIQIMNP